VVCSAIVLGGVLLASFLLPVPGADGRILGLPSVCVFYDVTGLPCPGCGLTRAFVCFAHGRMLEACHWNILGPLLFLVFLFLFVRALLQIFYSRNILPISERLFQQLTCSGAAMFVLFGILRIAFLTVEHRKF